MHRRLKYRTAYVALEEGFVLAPAVIDSRNLAGLTQKKLARKIGTSQPVVACLKIGRSIQYSCAPPNRCGQEGETMSKSTYPLKLPLSTKKAAQRLAREDGVSMNQWIAAAVAEKVGVVETAAEFFKRRAQGGDRQRASEVSTQGAQSCTRP